MKYNLVIGFSVLAFVITTVWRWLKINVYYQPVTGSFRQDDPYLYLVFIITILHFYWIISNADQWLKNIGINPKFMDRGIWGPVVIFGILLVLGIFASMFVGMIF